MHLNMFFLLSSMLCIECYFPFHVQWELSMFPLFLPILSFGWYNLRFYIQFIWVSHMALVVKNPPANAGDWGLPSSIPGSGRSPGGGHGNPLQYSCLENHMDRGGWQATVHWVTKSRTRLTWLSTHAISTKDRKELKPERPAMAPPRSSSGKPLSTCKPVSSVRGEKDNCFSPSSDIKDI